MLSHLCFLDWATRVLAIMFSSNTEPCRYFEQQECYTEVHIAS